MKKILITGGAGYVGTTLIPLLLKKGYEVTVIDSLIFNNGDRLIPFMSNEKFSFVKGDVRDLKLLSGLVGGKDVVIHLAAYVGFPLCRLKGEKESYDVNTKATEDLVNIVAEIKKYKFSRTNPSTKIFQALRIYINKEITELINGLIYSFKILPVGGMIVVVPFHSIEDKIVKFFFKNYSDKKNSSRYAPNIIKNNCLKLKNNKPIVPSNDETKINPASRSAKLRYAIKTDENDNFNELHEKFNYLIETENLSYNS